MTLKELLDQILFMASDNPRYLDREVCIANVEGHNDYDYKKLGTIHLSDNDIILFPQLGSSNERK